MKTSSRVLTLLAAAMIMIAPLVAVTPVSPVLASDLIVNGDFGAGQAPWWTAGVTAAVNGGVLEASAPTTANPWEAIVGQGGVSLTSGTLYTLTFDAWASAPANIQAIVQLDASPFTAYFNTPVALTTSSRKFSYTFTSPVTDPAAVLQFQIGANPAYMFHLDNVSLSTTVQRITNGDFSGGQAPWWTAGITAAINGGVLEAPVPASAVNPWEAIVGQGGVSLASGAGYTLSFDAWASAPVTIQTLVQLDASPFTAYFSSPVALATTSQHFSFTFTSPVTDPAAVLQFQVGGNGAFTFHLDNVSLTEPAEALPQPPPPHIGELLANGTFSSGQTAPWWATSSVSLAVAQGRLEATITNGGLNPWEAIVGQSDIPVFSGGAYRLTFKAWASQNATLSAILQKDGPPFTQYFSAPIALTSTPKTFTFDITSSAEDLDAVLQFQMGGQGNFVVYFDNFSLNGPEPVSHMQTGAELLINGNFGSGTNPWWNTANVALDASSGALQAAVVSSGPNVYDAITGQNNITVLAGGNYSLEFDAWASTPVTVVTLVQLNGPPFTQYFSSPVALTTASQHFSYTFTSLFADPAAGFQFQIGGHGPFVFNVDNVSLRGPKPTPPTEFLTAVRLNQVGYLPDAPKKATIAVDVTSPLPWTLYDSANAAVATGTTRVFGADSASGDQVHIADFSRFETFGTGYTLEVYGERSFPFDIGNDVYQQLKYDALAYYYQNRSGIEISMPFAGDPQWARPAGHLNVSPNQGDNNVPCFNQIDLEGHQWTGCNYTLDVAKGWYDAGDHGKYVVNGGISVWTLLNQYEHAKNFSSVSASAFADGTLNVPESHNHVPDILDEARWELEFMLSMQVPKNGRVEGVRLDGMVHHKVHDLNWTALGLRPDQDPQPRYLYPPSTAATLNLAANAAQCARIWERIDRAFSNRCLKAAETAWNAALAHPNMFARSNFTGGGGYDDTDVSDEFYWAASELFITTGKSQYWSFIHHSPHFLSIPGERGSGGVMTGSSMGWQKTQALGTISLVTVPNRLSGRDIHRAEDNLVRVGRGYVVALRGEGYRLPFKPGAGGYPWGSNSDVLNNMIILSLSYDFTHDTDYLNAVSEGMDYLLGRNPNARSYVSGYGEQSLQNPHHRFWAHQLNDSFPPPPPGALSGGPNSNLQDPFIQTLFPPGGCAAQMQKCYADHIESFSTNEVAINWNAPLAWVVAFLDDARALQDHPPHH